MQLNESLNMLIEQGFEQLAIADVTFGIKLLAIFGVFWLLTQLSKLGETGIYILVYIYGFIKWVVYKVKGKDI